MPVATGNLLVMQGGGPTPVLNTSLYGVLAEAANAPPINQVFGSRYGIAGIIKNDLVNLSTLSPTQIQLLKTSPGASLGSTRHRPTPDDLQAIVHNLRHHNIRYLLMIGGNGSLRGAEALRQSCLDAHHEIAIIGVPKTIDNDIAGTDRCPGFASAARYVAQSVRDLAMDVRTLPQPVSIYETMGRSVGWLAGASILAKLDSTDAPHLIHLPERPFDTDSFIAAVDRIVSKQGWAIIVVTEGIKSSTGHPIYETPHVSQQDALGRALPGGVGAFLSDLITRELKIRCRSEKPGLCGRASMLHVSPQDQLDAEAVGRAAVRAALDGHDGAMVSLLPLAKSPAPPQCHLVPLATALQPDRLVPRDWITDSDTAVTEQFIHYLRPLVGDLLTYPLPLKDSLP